MQVQQDIRAVHKISDQEIFNVLKEEMANLCSILLTMRNFAKEVGNEEDAKKIDLNIDENKQIISLINAQLDELDKKDEDAKMGLFDTFWAA